MRKFMFLAGLGIGFIVGSRVGRGPYEKLEETAKQFVEDPTVQEKAQQARETVEKFAGDAAETVKDKAPEVAAAIQGKASELGDKAGDAVDQAKDEAKKAADNAGDDNSSDAAGGTGKVSGDKPLSS